MKRILFIILPIALLSLTQCNGVKSFRNSLNPATGRDRYLANLEKAGLQDRPMVQKWIESGERALHDSIQIKLPFSETGSFIANEPRARSYQFDVKDGQVLTVTGTTRSTNNAHVFADLFTWKENEWKVEASSDSSITLSHEFTSNRTCLLRIQPELLVNAFYSVTISVTPVLINPVSGASNKSIQSFYGDSRDGGKRLHEGVDIFARKGTPVIAPTQGVVTRTGQSNLGGKVVWMSDQKRKHAYYFAHLDSQYVSPGQTVKQGDTLGTVGNTGNARSTPAHLHFGIYQRGSKDPIHYIRNFEETIENSPLDTTFQMEAFKVATKTTVLRSGPSADHLALQELPRETLANILGQSKDWYRVSLANQQEGYLPKKHLARLSQEKKVNLVRKTPVLFEPHIESVIMDYLTEDTVAWILAQHQEYQYIETSEGKKGWIASQAL